jgi:hypothetical protein
MGEGNSSVFSFSFNGCVRVVTRGSDLSADAGAVLLREVDEKLGLTRDLARQIFDPRNPDLITHPMGELLRARIFAMALGYTDQDDLDFLRDDPVLRLAVSGRRGTGPLDEPDDPQVPDGLASQPSQSRLVRTLSNCLNLEVLNRFLFTMAEREFAELGRQGPVVLDIDSFPIEVHGSQPGSDYSGHYHMRCFNPLVTMLSSTAAVLRADLRPGSTYTANGAVEHLAAVFDDAAASFGRVAAVRGDAGFPCEEFFSFLEARRVGYALRLKTNNRLEELAKPHLRRPPGRPPKEPRTWFHELVYRADPWSVARRVVLVVLERKGELFVDHFFLVTNYAPEQLEPEDLLEFYRGRATMERHLGEIKSVLSPTLSSSPRPKSHYRREEPRRRTLSIDGEKANAATFLLFLLGYNLMNTVRNLAASVQEPSEPEPSLARVRAHVLKVAARLTRSARYAFFVVNHASRALWGQLIERIARIENVVQLE